MYAYEDEQIRSKGVLYLYRRSRGCVLDEGRYDERLRREAGIVGWYEYSVVDRPLTQLWLV